MSAPHIIPVRYTFGNTNGWDFFYIVKLVLGGVQPIYFSTKKDATTLVDLTYLTHSISTTSDLVYSDKLAASVVNSNGDERDVDGIGEIDYSLSVQDGGGLASRNIAGLVFANQSRFDKFMAQFDVENGEVEFWEGYFPDATETFEITDNMILRFKGVLSSSAEYDYETMSVSCQDSRHLDSVYLPKTKVTKASFPHRPTESDGAVIPLVSGDFTTDIDIALGLTNLVPSLMTNDLVPTFYVADHELDSHAGVYYIADSGISGTFVTETDARTGDYLPDVDFGALGSSIRFGGGTPYADFVLIPKLLGSAVNYSGTQVLEHEGAVDQDTTTFVSVGNNYGLILRPPNIEHPGQYIASNDDRAFIKPSGGGVDIRVVVTLANVTGNVRVGTRFVNEASANAFDFSTNLSNGENTRYWTYLIGSVTGWGDLLNLEFVVDTTNGGTCDVFEIYFLARSTVYDVQTSLRYNGGGLPVQGRIFGSTRGGKPPAPIRPRPVSRIFLACGGAKYGNWITGRSSYSDGDLIENPAYYLEHLLRNSLNVIDNRIDTDSFDDAATARSDWKIASVILDQKKADDYLRQICFEFGMILALLPDSDSGDDRYTLIALPTDDDTADFTITQNAILWTDKPEIAVGYTSGDRIVNDLYLRFRKNYSTNDYMASVYLSDTNQDNVIESEVITGTGTGTITGPAFGIIQGTGTAFLSELKVGWYIIADGQEKRIASILGNTTLTTSTAFSPSLSVDTFTYSSVSSSADTPPRTGSYINWMTESLSRNRTRNPQEFGLDFISDESTASRLLHLYADWWAFKRQVVPMKIMKSPENASMRIGNILNINLDIVGEEYQAVVKYIVTKLNYPPMGKTTEPFISLECEEIPNALTGRPIVKTIYADWVTV